MRLACSLQVRAVRAWLPVSISKDTVTGQARYTLGYRETRTRAGMRKAELYVRPYGGEPLASCALGLKME